MNCREYQHQITLLFYEELPDKAQAGLQVHLEACGACQSVYESEKNMHSVLAEDAIRAAIGDWKKKQSASTPVPVEAKA